MAKQALNVIVKDKAKGWAKPTCPAACFQGCRRGASLGSTGSRPAGEATVRFLRALVERAGAKGDRQETAAFGELFWAGLPSLPILFSRFLSLPPFPILHSFLFIHSSIDFVVYLIISLLSYFPVHSSNFSFIHS